MISRVQLSKIIREIILPKRRKLTNDKDIQREEARRFFLGEIDKYQQDDDFIDDIITQLEQKTVFECRTYPKKSTGVLFPHGFSVRGNGRLEGSTFSIDDGIYSTSLLLHIDHMHSGEQIL
jgi:hypothetical protein